MKTGDGHRVYVNPTHMAQHQDVLPLLEEALSQVHPPSDKVFYKTHVDMGRIVGYQQCVNVNNQTDKFIFARRAGRSGLTRFVLDREPVETPYVTVVLARDRRGRDNYRLLTAYVGAVSEKEPTDPSIKTPAELAIAEEFWKDRALIWGSQTIVHETVQQTSNQEIHHDC